MTLPPRIPNRPFTWSEAYAAGLSRDRLTDLIDNGKVRRVLQGVYQPASLPDTLENRCRAAALVMRPFGVFCDRTAAWLHGVDTFDYRELEILPPLETFVLRDRSRTRRKGCQGGERDLDSTDLCVIDGIRVTTPLRTALDLGCGLGRRDALAALDGFMRQCGVTRAQLEHELPRYRRRRGVVQLRGLVPLATAEAESAGESWTRMAIIDAGIPAPQPQFWIVIDGIRRFRLDMAYPKNKVAVEYDGHEFHDDPERREADRERRTWLEQNGWTIIVVTSDSFALDALLSWTNKLADALRHG
jgi:Protein of unknown function (DUF559)